MPRARRKPAPPALIVRAEVAVSPTAQQQAKSVYRRADGLPGQPRATIHEMENKLRELEWLGALTPRQREAGELFEADYWACSASGGTRDPLDLTPRGEDHETEAAAERFRRASDRVAKAKKIAGHWYPALRDLCVFRKRVKSAAVTMPAVLDAIGDEYGLPAK